MNIKTRLYIFAGLLSLSALTACNDYLDQQPDDRAVVDSKEQVQNLLVSAYPTHSPAFLLEMSSDNVLDNGKEFSYQPDQNKMYRWQDVSEKSNDDPYYIWNDGYERVAVANEAIQDLKALGDSAQFPGEYAEALLCRAYNMFQLANVFCMAWNPDSADVYLGLPYPKEPEANVNTQYTRGTLRQLYENINRDIETALPNIDESYMTVPKYHFNKRAAYAFAARFNLFYHNYDKAIEYASNALGSDVTTMFRDFASMVNMNSADIKNAYVKTDVNANLMLVPCYSIAGRAVYSSSFRRFAHSYVLTSYEGFWCKGPWGSSSWYNTLYMSHALYGGTDQQGRFPKMDEFWEETDKINGTGYAHIVTVPFTTEETLLVRAEAEALKKDFTGAIADMNLWMQENCAAVTNGTKRPVLTEDYVNKFIENIEYAPVTPAFNTMRTIRKVFHPQGFTVEQGTQENLLQLILQMRRITTMHEGQRFIDVKRYGIEFSHNLDGENPLVFHAADKRGAIQLPEDVVKAGLEANPR